MDYSLFYISWQHDFGIHYYNLQITMSFAMVVYKETYPPHIFQMILQWKFLVFKVHIFFDLLTIFLKSSNKKLIWICNINTHVFVMYLRYDWQYVLQYNVSRSCNNIFRKFQRKVTWSCNNIHTFLVNLKWIFATWFNIHYLWIFVICLLQWSSFEHSIYLMSLLHKYLC